MNIIDKVKISLGFDTTALDADAADALTKTKSLSNQMDKEMDKVGQTASKQFTFLSQILRRYFGTLGNNIADALDIGKQIREINSAASKLGKVQRDSAMVTGGAGGGRGAAGTVPPVVPAVPVESTATGAAAGTAAAAGAAAGASSKNVAAVDKYIDRIKKDSEELEKKIRETREMGMQPSINDTIKDIGNQEQIKFLESIPKDATDADITKDLLEREYRTLKIFETQKKEVVANINKMKVDLSSVKAPNVTQLSELRNLESQVKVLDEAMNRSNTIIKDYKGHLATVPASANAAGTAVVDTGNKIEQTGKKANVASKMVGGFGRSLATLAKFTGIGLIIGAAIGVVSRFFSLWFSELPKLRKESGYTTRELIKMHSVWELLGFKSIELGSGFQTLIDLQKKFTEGTKESTAALERFNQTELKEKGSKSQKDFNQEVIGQILDEKNPIKQALMMEDVGLTREQVNKMALREGMVRTENPNSLSEMARKRKEMAANLGISVDEVSDEMIRERDLAPKLTQEQEDKKKAASYEKKYKLEPESPKTMEERRKRIAELTAEQSKYNKSQEQYHVIGKQIKTLQREQQNAAEKVMEDMEAESTKQMKVEEKIAYTKKKLDESKSKMDRGPEDLLKEVRMVNELADLEKEKAKAIEEQVELYKQLVDEHQRMQDELWDKSAWEIGDVAKKSMDEAIHSALVGKPATIQNFRRAVRQVTTAEDRKQFFAGAVSSQRDRDALINEQRARMQLLQANRTGRSGYIQSAQEELFAAQNIVKARQVLWARDMAKRARMYGRDDIAINATNFAERLQATIDPLASKEKNAQFEYMKRTTEIWDNLQKAAATSGIKVRLGNS